MVGTNLVLQLCLKYINLLCIFYHVSLHCRPHIAPDKIECLFDELKRSLSGVKELLSVKYQTTSSANGRRKRGRKRKRGQREKEREGHVNEPVAKKLCLETATDESPVTPQSEIDESASTFDLLQSSRKSQLVVGTNAFTRSLEEGTLRVGVVCLSAKPALIHKHILQLSATRKVPVVALADLSSTIAPLLGMKSALAIGVKVRKITTTYT